MKIVWDESFTTDIELMDKEHHELVLEFNKLTDSMKHIQQDVYFSLLMVLVEKYINVHFAHEEALQQELNYPAYEQHKLLHEYFKSEVLRMVDIYYEDNASEDHVDYLHGFMINWLITHIKNADKTFGEYANKTK